jgi:hypothetical protein
VRLVLIVVNVNFLVLAVVNIALLDMFHRCPKATALRGKLRNVFRRVLLGGANDRF